MICNEHMNSLPGISIRVLVYTRPHLFVFRAFNLLGSHGYFQKPIMSAHLYINSTVPLKRKHALIEPHARHYNR